MFAITSERYDPIYTWLALYLKYNKSIINVYEFLKLLN